MRTLCLITGLLLTAWAITGSAVEAKKTAGNAIIEAAKSGNHDEAIALAQALVAVDEPPDELASVLTQAAATTAQAKHYAAAAELYQLAATAFPEHPQIQDTHTELAACQYYSRQLEACQAQLAINLKRYPQSPWFEYWEFLHAQIHFRLWRYEEAKTALWDFLLKYPDGDYTDHARAYVNRINPPLDVDENGVVAYSGKLASDIRMRQALASLPRYMDAGHKMLQERLGFDLRPHTRVLYQFRDADPQKKGGQQATTRIIAVDNKPTTIIYFKAEAVVINDGGFRKTTIHEMKHAGFIGLMGARYHELPNWIREGLALWGSKDVETRMNLVLCNEIIAKRDPLAVLDGIDDFDHDVRDYMEDALAFEWLAARDPKNIVAFCRRLVAGEPYREVWADLAGMPYKDAMAAANAHCRQRVVTALGKGYESFVPLRQASEKAMQGGPAATQKWLDDGGRASFQQWFDDYPGHAAEPMARMSLARAFIIARRFDAGRELLQLVLKEDGLRSTLMDDAQFWLGVSYNHQGDQAKSAEAFGVLLRDYPNSSNAKSIRGKFPAAGPVLE